MAICRDCHRNPCLVSLHQDALTGQLSVLTRTMSSSHKCNVLYYCFVQTEYGVLGKHNQVCIPLCVVQFICSICPSDDGRHTGHQAAEEGGDVDEDDTKEDDAVNTSYEEIEEEASPNVVHFKEGQAICLSMFFKTSQFSAEHVVGLFLNLPSKDGKFLTNRNYSLQPPSFAMMNTPIRHCACFVLEKLMIALSSQVL